MSDIPTAEPIPARRYAKPKNWKKPEQRANPTHPQLRTWIQHVAGAIHYFADRDGVTRKFPREIADHIGIAEGTIRRNLKQMTAAGAVVIAEPGSRNGWTRPGYRLHESIASKFPKLSRYSKALIRRVSPWELAAGKSVHKSGKSAGKE